MASNPASPPPAYAEARPDRDLRHHVASVWIERGESAQPRDRVLPDGFVDLIWGSRLWVRGPDTRHHLVSYPRERFFVGVRFRYGAAASLLGVPATDLLDRRVHLTELWDGTGSRLEERLAEAVSPEEALRVLQSALSAQVARADAPDGLVMAVASEIARGRSPSDVRALAAQVHLSERQLRRRCTVALGYGPKTLDRFLRLQRVLQLAQRWPTANVGALAARGGYADQAHLARECRRLSGLSPLALLGGVRARATDVRSLQDAAACPP